MHCEILVLDFGSQYTQLIARRLRDYGIYTEIVPYFESLDSIKVKNPKGIILSGGPASVYEEGAYKPDSGVFGLNVPILGICYGMQYIADFFGGKVVKAEAQEFGKATLEILESRSNLEFTCMKEEDIDSMLALWEDSIKASHYFLTHDEIKSISKDVLSAFKQVRYIIVARIKGEIVGFIGIEDSNFSAIIKMLFVSPRYFTKGIGRALLSEAYAKVLKNVQTIRVDCNEQNPNALKFYQRLGFKRVGRSERDPQGRAYPIIHFEMRAQNLYQNLIESTLSPSSLSLLFKGVKQYSTVWMSHADKVEQIPQGFSELAKSGNTHYCAIANQEKKIYALQFHPEVVHSEYGGEILKNFALYICGADDSWNMHNFAETEIRKLREIVLGDSIEGDHAGLDSADYERKCRCQWAKAGNLHDEKIYWAYHDNQWGVPLHNDIKLFEFLVLEGFQAGLSWLTILKKRESFREAFDGFDPKLVAQYDEAKILNLMENEGIIRNRLKIESAINNAQKFLEIQKEFGSFDGFIWSYVGNKPIINAFENHYEIPTHTPLSDKISQDLENRGFKFVGSTIMYAFMQAIGMVNDHLLSCFVRENLNMQSGQKRRVQGSGKVLCAVSGGVDSSVVATLLYRAIGEALIPVFVDTGLLRKGEREAVEAMFRENLKVPLIVCDASELFLSRLKGVVDPEQKRKIIGETFIEVFESEAKKHNTQGEIRYLAQGTLYPDVIESVSIKGPSKTIKSHHNVGGLPEWMKFELIEPLRELFKDEVRELGGELGMPEMMLMRHPFPGPGLAIRIMGEVNEADLDLLREADSIFIEELHKHGLYNKVWQAFCVLLNVRSVGVMGDNRTYDNTICLRAVEALDGMTASFSHLPHEFLESVSNRIINEVEGINRVVYDITSKPPGTIEWE